MAAPHVVYWNNQPTPYFVERMNEVVRRGKVHVEAWFDVERRPDRSWDVDPSTWLFPARYVTQKGRTGHRLQIPTSELRSAKPDVFIGVLEDLSSLLGIVSARRWAHRVALRGLPHFETWGSRRSFRELGKHVVFGFVDGAKVPGMAGQGMVTSYGLPSDRVWPVTQAINVPKFARARDVPQEARNQLRKHLGVTGTVFLYVGRLWNGKGVQHLIEAYRLVRAEHPNSSLLLVGDGPDEAELRERAAEIEGVVFAGFVQPDDIAEYFAIGDALVFPTLGDPHGLVIEESMAAGLPVITTSSAGDARRRVRNDRTGYVVEPANPTDLAAAMMRLASNPELRAALSERCVQTVEDQGVTAYAEDFEVFIRELLAKPARRSAYGVLSRFGARAVDWWFDGKPGSLRPPG